MMPSFFSIILLGLLLIGVPAGCSNRLPPLPSELIEVQRISSGNGRVDAVLFSSDAGATTSTGTHLFLVPHGHKVQSLKYAVLSMDHVGNLALNWSSDKEVIVSWQHRAVDDYKHIVEITLSPSSSDSLPRKEIEF